MVVRVRIDAAAGLLGREALQVPGAPAGDTVIVLVWLVRHRVRRVGVVVSARPGARLEPAGGRDAARVDEVRWYVRHVGRGKVDDGHRQVVAVHQADVVKGLLARRAAPEGKLCQGGGDAACEFAVESPEAVARRACRARPSDAAPRPWPAAVRVEGAVCAAPDAALPVPTDVKLARLARLQLEAAGAGPAAVLSADAGPYRFSALVGDDYRDGEVIIEGHLVML